MLLENIKSHIIRVPDTLSEFQKFRVSDNQKLIFRALAETAVVAPHLLDLAQTWLQAMPRMPVGSQTLRSIANYVSTGKLPLDQAITCPWICPNSETVVNAIMIDVDHPNIEDKIANLVALGCPKPTVIQDSYSLRSHAVLFLSYPVSISDKAHQKPQKALDFATRLLAKALDGTHLKHKALVKSPWGLTRNLIGHRLFRTDLPESQPVWDSYVESKSPLMWHTMTGSGPCELGQIISALCGDYRSTAHSKAFKTGRRNRAEPSALGRNCAIFDLTRWEAYDGKIIDPGELYLIADRHNREMFAGNPLPANELHSLARSISSFMLKRYRPEYGRDPKFRYGRDKARHTEDMSLRERQSLAGQISAKQVVEKHDEQIKKAIESIFKQDGKFSLKRITELTKLSRVTLWRRKSEIMSLVWGFVSSAVLSASGRKATASSKFFKSIFANLKSILQVKDLSKRLVKRGAKGLEGEIQHTGRLIGSLSPWIRKTDAGKAITSTFYDSLSRYEKSTKKRQVQEGKEAMKRAWYGRCVQNAYQAQKLFDQSIQEYVEAHPNYEYLGAIVRQKIKSFQAIKDNALMGRPYDYRDLPIDDVRDVGW